MVGNWFESDRKRLSNSSIRENIRPARKKLSPGHCTARLLKYQYFCNICNLKIRSLEGSLPPYRCRSPSSPDLDQVGTGRRYAALQWRQLVEQGPTVRTCT